ncbi:MAG: L-histidine N(alpha)-methyltransferase [Thiohalocapsa sp.]|jgi:dimethylhistidine N-methyltransferase|uniref:L-histidine N(alpha)-methyltransferase n=1 Tax=Thiohalocapsa sp. TaxID=2497641 RepID=UPI0025E2E397|nr:L-histidine N(alpha)-methyltransferase [Thiohalocapsa sp.]MCG6940376.1 L-histidine N(alpha)-methyltransferase [Thiohalocapsa sp.]
MNAPMSNLSDSTSRVHFHDLKPTPADMRAEVLSGLALPQKRLSPKFFYDAAGSRLFDAICELPEYYPTRTEIGILRRHGAEMAARLGRDALLIELGSGSSLKIRTLLTALRPAVYMPVDISGEHLLRSAQDLAAAFPGLIIHAVCADYSAAFVLPVEHHEHPRAAFFPGSSIGNFEPPAATRFLKRVGEVLGPGGRLLIGVDLVKDIRRLDAAYNDADGVTAAFNLNLLTRINRELGADFDCGAFRHDAFFDVGQSRIEMHLVSTRPQRVQVAGQAFDFAEGETIHTECSYKYRVDGFHALAAEAGFIAEQVWTDADALFSVHCLVWG